MVIEEYQNNLKKIFIFDFLKRNNQICDPKTTFVTEEVINIAFEVTSRRYECAFPPKSFYKKTFNDFSLNLLLYNICN